MISSAKTSGRPSQSPAESADQTEMRANGDQASILVVEDDFLIALELENRLLDAGYRVVGIAASASEAFTLGDRERPDLVVMDIRLVGRRDGVDAAIELFKEFGIRSIFASAHADPQTRERAAPANPIGWVQKPYPADALIRLIRDFLGR